MLRARRHPSPGRWRYCFRALAQGGVALAIFGVILLGAAFPVTVQGLPSTPTLRAAALPLPGLAASAPTVATTSLEAAPVLLTVVAPPVTEEALLQAADGTQAALGTLEQAQRNASVVAEGVLTTREPERQFLYYRYAVRAGDNLTKIASDFDIDRKYIVWNNADVIDNEDLLSVGLVLQIPTVPGIIHGVRAGETLTEIALAFGAEVEDIIDFRANGLTDPNRLREGDLILVVGGKRLPPPAPSIRPGPTGAVSELGWAWPLVSRQITSKFGPQHRLGIDVATLYQPVYAAAGGKVIFAGGDPWVSYGYYIEVDHGGGWVTLYAHLSRLNVRRGDTVERGDVIAISGDTGNSTGPHLHFELNRYGTNLDPLGFLP